MKTIVQLLIVALILNASARAGMAALRFYQFKDAVEQEARFGGKETEETLRRRVISLAEEQGIEIFPADIAIQRDGTTTTISAAYLENIQLVPRFYAREHLFEFEVSARPARPLTPEDVK